MLVIFKFLLSVLYISLKQLSSPWSKLNKDSDKEGIVPAQLTPTLVVGAFLILLCSILLSLLFGPVSIRPDRIFLEIFDRIPGISVDSGLSKVEAAIVWDVRLPRIVLGLIVGGLLAMAGASYQGVFRNPLADPYLLGVAAGAGLGATVAIVSGASNGTGMFDALPIAAFLGSAIAVGITLAVGGAVSRSTSTASLLLAGVAVASLFTAIQTYIQQRESATLRQVYSWILGRLSTSGWDEVLLILPYALVSVSIMYAMKGALDVLAVGEEEALSLGLRPERVRWVVIAAASLASASAVAVSGLIAFVGIIVPHAVRLVVGASNRLVVPLSFLIGAAFLMLTDLLARTLQSPAELPIGVVTAFFGAPFFLFVLRRRSDGVI